MTQLYLIRHGDYYREEQPPYDLGLTTIGIRQAERLRDRLRKENPGIDVLIASPAIRAQQTAEILAPAVRRSIITEPDIDEWRNTGEQALSSAQIIEEYLSRTPDQRAFLSPGEGLETWAQFAIRVCNTLNRITQQYAHQSILIVAHGGVVEASFVYCFGLSPFNAPGFMMMLDVKHTAITHWHKVPAVHQWRLETYNDIYHLQD